METTNDLLYTLDSQPQSLEVLWGVVRALVTHIADLEVVRGEVLEKMATRAHYEMDDLRGRVSKLEQGGLL